MPGGWASSAHPRTASGKFAFKGGGHTRTLSNGFMPGGGVARRVGRGAARTAVTGGYVAVKSTKLAGRIYSGIGRASMRVARPAAYYTYYGAKAVGVGAVRLGVKGYRRHRVSVTRKEAFHQLQRADRASMGYRNGEPKGYSKKSLQSIDRSQRAYHRALERSAMSSARKR